MKGMSRVPYVYSACVVSWLRVRVPTLTFFGNCTPPAPKNRRAPPTATAAPFVAESYMVQAAIKTFPGGSAGGPDGLRPQHLKDLLIGLGRGGDGGEVGGGNVQEGLGGQGAAAPTSSPLLEVITKFINFC